MFHPVQAEEMAFAITLFVNAGTGQISAGQKPLTIRNRKDGVKLFLTLSSPASGPLSREQGEAAVQSELFQAFLIVWEHYRSDTSQVSIAARLLGFFHLMTRTRGKALETWVEPSVTTDEVVILHPAVIETLASTGLLRNGRLDEVKFLREVAVAAETNKAEAGRQTEAKSIWPANSGEMETLVREHNWAATPLGPLEGWPQSLKTAVDLALACRFPMVVLWGPELIQVYNTGYCDLMGDKHPGGLGQATRECWPEVWHINEPIYARVFQGETLTFEDGLYPITRRGDIEDAYFTLCYSPLRDEAARIAGILVTVFETTERVQAEAAPSRQLDGEATRKPHSGGK